MTGVQTCALPIWVIILIVAVFDPLALVLILAAQQSLRWAQEDRDNEEHSVPAYTYEDFEKPTDAELAEIDALEEPIQSKDPHPPGWMFDKKEEHTPDEVNKHTEPPPVTEEPPAYPPDDGPLTDEQIKALEELAAAEAPQGEVVETSKLFDDTLPVTEELAKEIYPPGWMYGNLSELDTIRQSPEEEPDPR